MYLKKIHVLTIYVVDSSFNKEKHYMHEHTNSNMMKDEKKLIKKFKDMKKL